MTDIIAIFEELKDTHKDCLVGAAFSDYDTVWKNVFHLYFEEANADDIGILQKHIIENYWVAA